MNRSLPWWDRDLGNDFRRELARIWPYTPALGCVWMILALFVSNVGFIPGVGDPDTVLNITLITVLISAVLFPLSFISAISSRLVNTSHAIKKFAIRLKKHAYSTVHWDQRHAGRSFFRNLNAIRRNSVALDLQQQKTS